MLLLQAASAPAKPQAARTLKIIFILKMTLKNQTKVIKFVGQAKPTRQKEMRRLFLILGILLSQDMYLCIKIHLMKILIINASPRQHGNISQMAEMMRLEAEQCKAEVSMVRVADLSVRPCTACMTCRKTLKCALPEDDAQRVLRLITAADALIVCAPCYWGNMPGELKVLFDRMVYGLMGENKRGIPIALHKGKKAIVVSACTTIYPFNIMFRQTRGVVNALKEILKWSGFKLAGTLEKGGTKNKPVLITRREEKKCRRLVHKLW
jgi:multimeric flavodoxin WrbA